MSDSAKKPTPPPMEEATTIMTNPSGDIPTTLNLDDDVIDENYTFDQKTVVHASAKTTPPLPPPLAKTAPAVPTPPPIQAEAPKVPDVPSQTGSFKITNPKINTPQPAAAATMAENTVVTSSQSSIRAGRGAVKIEATAPVPPMPEVAPGDELEFEKKRKKKAQNKEQGNGKFELPPFVQNLLQNKRALAGIGGFLVVFVIFGVWKSHQPRQLDLHLDESSSKPAVAHESAQPVPGAEIPTAEQAASHFETVFQRVQVDGGDVSR